MKAMVSRSSEAAPGRATEETRANRATEAAAHRSAAGEAIQRYQAVLSGAPGVAAIQQKQEMANGEVKEEEERVQRKPNDTGLPDGLKAGVESLSGVGLDDVKVHYGSDKPAELSALAYTQGSEIHVAPGQERHLPHEAWHVAQQKQGRVPAISQVNGVALNDDPGLENEADVMGNKALLTKPVEPAKAAAVQRMATPSAGGVIQCLLPAGGLPAPLQAACTTYNNNRTAAGANPTNAQLQTLTANLQAVHAAEAALAPLHAMFVPPGFAAQVTAEENWVRVRQAANVAPQAFPAGPDAILAGYLE